MIFISHKLWLLSSAFLRLLFQSAQLPFPTATCFLHFSIAPSSLALSTRDLFSRAFHRIHITLPIRLLHVFARVSPTTFYGWHAYRHLSAKIIFPLFFALLSDWLTIIQSLSRMVLSLEMKDIFMLFSSVLRNSAKFQKSNCCETGYLRLTQMLCSSVLDRFVRD